MDIATSDIYGLLLFTATDFSNCTMGTQINVQRKINQFHMIKMGVADSREFMRWLHFYITFDVIWSESRQGLLARTSTVQLLK
jgi:hypothetical protein